MRFPTALLMLLTLLLLGPGLSPAHGEDEREGEDAGALLQLGPALVLASPGAPAALDAFLPGGKRPGDLVWPLPKGPVVVLGLPLQDETARQIADAFQIDTEDLEGGYRIAAWRTKTRPLVLIMAADKAALHAARFEFDVDAPMEMMAPGMRSLDFKRPNQEAGFAVRPGRRLVQPRYRVRGFDVRAAGQAVGTGLVATAAGARANRLWLSLKDLAAPGIAKTLALARRHGVDVVACDDDVRVAQCTDAAYLQRVIERLQAVRTRAGIRHFAVAFRQPEPGLTLPDNAKREADVAYRLANALRPGGLDELTIIPTAHSDDLAKTYGGPPALGRIPEAVIAWSGPSRYATAITRAQAEQRVKEAGVPVVLLDHWAAPFQDPTVPYVPSLPRGRAPDLHDVLDGVIVIGRHGTEAMLESLWTPVEEPRFGMGLLRSLCPLEEEGGLAWLAAHTKRLAAADKENLGFVPWIEPLRRELAAIRPLVVAGHALELGTLSRAQLRIDGHVDEAPWAAGGLSPWVKTSEGLTVRLIASPQALHVAVVAPNGSLAARELLLRIVLRRPGARRGLVAELTTKGWHLSGALAGGAPVAEAVSGAVLRTGDTLTAELALSRFALGGEPHCGRAFEASIHWGPQRLWPKDAAHGAIYVGMSRAKVDVPLPKK